MNTSLTTFRSSLSAQSLALLGVLMAVSLPGCGSQNEKADALLKTAARQHEDGRNDDAIATLTRCIALRPDSAEALYLRGTCYGADGKTRKAIADLKQATKCRPEWDRAWWCQQDCRLIDNCALQCCILLLLRH